MSAQAPLSREELETRIGEVVSLLGASEANAKLGRLAQCVDEVDSADAKLLSLVDSIMALQAEVERLRTGSPLGHIEIKSYKLQRENRTGTGPYCREVTLDRYEQMEGPDKWAIKMGSHVLNKYGQWEYEPMPSSRDDEYLERCRYLTPEEALVMFEKARQPK